MLRVALILSFAVSAHAQPGPQAPLVDLIGTWTVESNLPQPGRAPVPSGRVENSMPFAGTLVSNVWQGPKGREKRAAHEVISISKQGYTRVWADTEGLSHGTGRWLADSKTMRFQMGKYQTEVTVVSKDAYTVKVSAGGAPFIHNRYTRVTPGG